MAEPAPAIDRSGPLYAGLRMSAEEFLRIPDDGFNYELVQGVVVMSPSPSARHQAIVSEIAGQIFVFLRERPVGQMIVEVDVHLGAIGGRDVVYRPELIFLREERWRETGDTVRGAPDLVVEVVSRGSRRFDGETKRDDYERFGAREYWLVDPERDAITFHRLEGGHFVTVAPEGDGFASAAVPGFRLDLARVRALFTR